MSETSERAADSVKEATGHSSKTGDAAKETAHQAEVGAGFFVVQPMPPPYVAQ